MEQASDTRGPEQTEQTGKGVIHTAPGGSLGHEGAEPHAVQAQSGRVGVDLRTPDVLRRGVLEQPVEHSDPVEASHRADLRPMVARDIPLSSMALAHSSTCPRWRRRPGGPTGRTRRRTGASRWRSSSSSARNTGRESRPRFVEENRRGADDRRGRKVHLS